MCGGLSYLGVACALNLQASRQVHLRTNQSNGRMIVNTLASNQCCKCLRIWPATAMVAASMKHIAVSDSERQEPLAYLHALLHGRLGQTHRQRPLSHNDTKEEKRTSECEAFQRG